ncbi:MAG: hypothetical protein HC895_05905 [Leptolyngbyaceae cyanobacterium SM1_3_5]|nr:hypothetical protein [Leptolyngbyaceae cyanobacterium SM1_3_5]
MLAVLGLILFSNLIKQAYAWYFVRNLQAYEVEIKKELGEGENSQIFSFNIGKEEARFVIASYRLELICEENLKDAGVGQNSILSSVESSCSPPDEPSTHHCQSPA